MARKPEPASPGKDHNSKMNEEDILAARAAEERIQAKIAAANRERSLLRKALKAKGVKLVNWDAAKRMAELERDEVKGDLKETFEYLRAFQALPSGTQAELFPKAEKPDPSKAYADGLQKGTKAEGRGVPPPEFSTGEFAQQWLKGWHDGQAKVANSWFSKTDFSQLSDDDPALAAGPGEDEDEEEGEEKPAPKKADNVVPLKKDGPKDPDVKKAVADMAKAVNPSDPAAVVKRVAAKGKVDKKAAPKQAAATKTSKQTPKKK